LRRRHRLFDGVRLRRLEGDLLLVLHDEPRGKDVREEGWWTRPPSAHHVRAAAMGRPGLRHGGHSAAREHGEERGKGKGLHTRSLPGEPCDTVPSLFSVFGHPSSESSQPIDGTVAYSSTPSGSSKTSVGLWYSPSANRAEPATPGVGAGS